MPRCRMRRRVFWEPEVSLFRPFGGSSEEVLLAVEEAEAIRLSDSEGMAQEEAALKMGVSQPTFSRVLESARKKIAEAITEGKRLRITGGDYMVEKGVPKRDGSGKGVQANRGRGGCNPPEFKGIVAKGNCPRGLPNARRRGRMRAGMTR